MTQIRLFLADASPLFRDGLKRLLHGGAFVVAGEASSLEQAVAALAAGIAADLLVADFAPEDEVRPLMARLRGQWPDMKVVVLSGSFSRRLLERAITCSADAFLLKDMAADALARSLELVMLGQQIFPTRLMMSAMPADGDGDGRDQALRASSGLSPRELEILRMLVNGDSNKAIARELTITEATVKVHLKALLRKVRVNNRTQAAVWAIHNGLERGDGAADDTAVPKAMLGG
jgi:two-component system nitrate/nitrite response regulator NarL